MKQVYLLSDPRSGAPMYVGATKLKLNNRLYHHIANASCSFAKRKWLDGLSKDGLTPSIELLEDFSANWELMESHWISLLRSWGFSLINADNQGKGFLYKRSPAHKKKMSQSLMGHATSDRTRRAVAESNKRRTGTGGKLVINLNTGIFYETIREAAESQGIDRKLLSTMLRRKTIYKNISIA